MIFVSSIRSMDVELSLAEVMDRLDTHPVNRLSRTNRGQDHLNSKRPKFSDTRKHLRRLQTGPLVEPNHRSSIEGMTSQAWEDMKQSVDYRCLYCSDVVPSDEFHGEHMTPLARGGANHIGNIAPACLSCNLRKGTMPPKNI